MQVVSLIKLGMLLNGGLVVVDGDVMMMVVGPRFHITTYLSKNECNAKFDQKLDNMFYRTNHGAVWFSSSFLIKHLPLEQRTKKKEYRFVIVNQ